jgi:hypothetical protein
VLSGRGRSVARYGGGDVSGPRAKPQRCRLARDALSDLLCQGVARMGSNPVGRLRVRVSEQPACQCTAGGTRRGSRDQVGGRTARSPRAAVPVAAGVDDKPLGQSQSPVQLVRVADLSAGWIVVGHIQREPIGLTDIGRSEAARHLASRHPVRVARIQVHPVALRLEGLDGVRQHLQPCLSLGVAAAAVQPSERVRLQDHDRRPVTEAGGEPADPLLVRLHLGFKPAIQRVQDQIRHASKHEKDTGRGRSDHSPAESRKPDHGWEYYPVSCSPVTAGTGPMILGPTTSCDCLPGGSFRGAPRMSCDETGNPLDHGLVEIGDQPCCSRLVSQAGHTAPPALRSRDP